VTALADIRKCLSALSPAGAGMERAILVGISAERSIMAELRIREDAAPELPDSLFGTIAVTTREFDGWAVRDCDAAGVWHDIEVL